MRKPRRFSANSRTGSRAGQMALGRTLDRGILFYLMAILLTLTVGCASNWQTGLVAGGITMAGAHSPTTEIEQIYYLGIFDPQDQVPPAIYRVTVHGQSSLISLARFASGWVPAEVADSLTSRLEFGDQGALTVSKVDAEKPAVLNTGRRLVLFGPEGFREAPRDSRLVIIMGSDPSKYFGAVSSVMEAMSKSGISAKNSSLVTQILLLLTQSQDEKDQLQTLLTQMPSDLQLQN